MTRRLHIQFISISYHVISISINPNPAPCKSIPVPCFCRRSLHTRNPNIQSRKTIQTAENRRSTKKTQKRKTKGQNNQRKEKKKKKSSIIPPPLHCAAQPRAHSSPTADPVRENGACPDAYRNAPESPLDLDPRSAYSSASYCDTHPLQSELANVRLCLSPRHVPSKCQIPPDSTDFHPEGRKKKKKQSS